MVYDVTHFFSFQMLFVLRFQDLKIVWKTLTQVNSCLQWQPGVVCCVRSVFCDFCNVHTVMCDEVGCVMSVFCDFCNVYAVMCNEGVV